MLSHKDLLGLRDMSVGEMEAILRDAAKMKERLRQSHTLEEHPAKSALKGKSVITLFYEDSTRTRLSFELAAKYMGAVAANITAKGSSVQKGESLIDTARTIDRMAADIIVIRHPASGAPELIAHNVNAAVINAGDGINEHPTQALLDMFTILERKGRIDGLTIAIVGDIAHSRVARSNIFGLTRMGARVRLGGPSTLMPKGVAGATVCNSVDEAITDADVIIALRVQLERQEQNRFPSIREYSRLFGIDDNRLRRAKPDVLIMHPGPVNRGVELTGAAADDPRSAIDEQVTNGVAVRMSILHMLCGREGLN